MRLHWRLKSRIVKAYLKYLGWSGRHIVIGPNRGELGFEVLYWLPFLNWALTYGGISQDRCLALSRGGMGVFYPCAHNADLYTLCSVDGVRLENNVDHMKRGIQKPSHCTRWDRAAVKEAAEAQWGKGCRFSILHPSWMYWLFDDFWEERATSRLIAAHTRLDSLPVPTLPEGFELPEKFIAVRFYERHTFPLDQGVPAYAAGIVQAIASHMPVVLLNQPSICADDHIDLPIEGPNIFRLPDVPPEQNFIMQAAVLARCEAFVGTYGGVAQWALRYGKPVISFYAHFSGTAQAHRTLSAMLSASQNVPFEVSDLKALRLWGMCLTRKAVEAAKETTAA